MVGGWLVPAEWFWLYLQELGQSELLFTELEDTVLHIDTHKPRQLQMIAQKLRAQIHQGQMLAPWLEAIAQHLELFNTAALQLSGFLLAPANLHPILEMQICPRRAEATADGIRQIWGQMFSAKNLFYWHTTKVTWADLQLVILVQPLIPALAAGTLQRQGRYLLITASRGLYPAIARSEVIPEQYVVDIDTAAVVHRVLGSKTIAYQWQQSALTPIPLEPEQQSSYSLSPDQIQELVHIAQPCLLDQLELRWLLSEADQRFWLEQVHLAVTAINPLLQGSGVGGGWATGPAFILKGEPGSDISLGQQIIVAEQLQPSWLPFLHQAAGIITEYGGLTSHAAIIARELRIPAVVGVQGATSLIQPGEELLLDSDQGVVYRPPLPSLEIPKALEPDRARPAKIITKLMLNLSQPQLASSEDYSRVDGVGLWRSEALLSRVMADGGTDAEMIDRLAAAIRQVGQLFAPRAVFYRTLDAPGQEFSQFSTPQAQNPALGIRGASRYLRDASLFDVELTALVESGCGNVNLILPFVRNVEEFQFCRRRAEAAGFLMHPQRQIWIMAEVPSVLFLLPAYAQAGVQGIAIGTNDLSQLLMGSDRDYPGLAHLNHPAQPAILAAIKQLITQAQDLGIPCSVCGQAPVNYPEIIPMLIQWGATAISVDLPAVESVYWQIFRAEQQLLLQSARTQLKSNP